MRPFSDLCKVENSEAFDTRHVKAVTITEPIDLTDSRYIC